jgi:DNA-binding MarR family transcriptional regulator
MTNDNVDAFLNQVKLLNRRLRRERPLVAGLTSASSIVLTTAARSPVSLRPGQLATLLQMTTPNMAASLRSLEEAGLIVRRQDPDDGRQWYVDVTKKGRAVDARHQESRHAWLRSAIDEVLDERERRLLFRAGELIERLADYESPQGTQRVKGSSTNGKTRR